MDVKLYIRNRLLATGRENIDKVIEYMEENSYFKKSCHHHHRYTGGLAEHAWQTYQIALYIKNEVIIQDRGSSSLDEDSIAICAILHDLCNCDNMPDIRGHGRRSAKMLERLGFKLKSDEFLAIRFHMGLHSKRTHPLYDEAKKCNLLTIIHKADKQSAKLGNGCM